MRISDWSSDVCSSDLQAAEPQDAADRGEGWKGAPRRQRAIAVDQNVDQYQMAVGGKKQRGREHREELADRRACGAAQRVEQRREAGDHRVDRKGLGEGKRVAGRVD